MTTQPTTGDTLRLSLDAAIDRVRAANPMLLAERAAADGAAQLPGLATGAFLPNVTLQIDAFRTTDPVAVFGSRLRQERFMMEDLALDALNRPDPYSDVSASVMIQQPLVAPEGWFGHSAAQRAVGARSAQASRQTEAFVLQTARAYWGALLARAQIDALEAAIAAAEGHQRQAELLNQQGLVTGLDARLARLHSLELGARRIGAEAAAANAVAGLRSLMALPESVTLALTDSLFVTDTGARAPAADGRERSDLVAATFVADAARLNVKRAIASNLPSIGAFASLASHGQSSPLGNASGHWTVGVRLSWTPLAALSGLAEVRKARAERSAAEARVEATDSQARLEQVQATNNLEAAGGQLRVAETAMAEADVALQQGRVRYGSGVASMTELLDVQAAHTATTLRRSAARHDLLVARAAFDYAHGIPGQ